MLRKIMPWLSALLIAAAIYDGAVFYSRWSANRAAEHEAAASEAERDRRVVEMLGEIS